MKLTQSLLVAALVITPTFAHANDLKDARDFVRKAAVANTFEIETSKVALQRSQREDVRKFAQRMIDDHGMAGDSLKTAATNAKVGIKVPTALDDKHREKLSDLRREKDGKDFNDKYIDEQQDAHKEAVDLFKDYADNGKNTALRDFAAKTLPTLEDHKKEIETIDSND